MMSHTPIRLTAIVALALAAHGVCLAQDDADPEVKGLPDGKTLIVNASKKMGGGEKPDERVMLQHTTKMPKEVTEGGYSPDTLVMTSAAPDKLHLETRWTDGRAAQAVAYDGEYCWGNGPDDPEFHLQDSMEIFKVAPIATPQTIGMRMLQFYDTFETAAIYFVEDTACYVVDASHSERDRTLRVFIEQETGALKGFMLADDMGKLVIREWADYKGVKVVRKADAIGMGPEVISFEYTDYASPELKKRLWEIPDSVQVEIDSDSDDDDG